MSELALLPCPKCGGSGSFEEPNPFFIHDDDDSTEDEFHSVACPACSGAGKLSAGACPHCGSHDVFVERADTSSAYVMCNDCACRGPIGSTEGDDMEEVPGGIEAITAWNKRTPTEWQDIESARKVKPLEWRKWDARDNGGSADTILGHYHAWTHHEAEGKWFWRLTTTGLGPRVADGEVASEAEAKAAAQADYESRILSALVAPPVKP